MPCYFTNIRSDWRPPFKIVHHTLCAATSMCPAAHPRVPWPAERNRAESPRRFVGGVMPPVGSSRAIASVKFCGTVVPHDVSLPPLEFDHGQARRFIARPAVCGSGCPCRDTARRSHLRACRRDDSGPSAGHRRVVWLGIRLGCPVAGHPVCGYNRCDCCTTGVVWVPRC